MFRIPVISLGSLLLAACNAAPAQQADTAPPDAPASQDLTVFTGGTIYTGLDEPLTVEAVLVDADSCIFVSHPMVSPTRFQSGSWFPFSGFASTFTSFQPPRP